MKASYGPAGRPARGAAPSTCQEMADTFADAGAAEGRAAPEYELMIALAGLGQTEFVCRGAHARQSWGTRVSALRGRFCEAPVDASVSVGKRRTARDGRERAARGKKCF
jgi:hypothetical protein